MTYLDYFKEMCTIPHGSGNTKAVSDWLVGFAQKHELEYYQDSANNVVIIKEAAAGMENAEPVIIQGHMDMVAVHDDDRVIDMEKEGLDVQTDGDFLFARGTSLGGDDGIAVAYGLALLSDDTLKLPRIELVVTVDEEIGMLGANVMDLSMLKGHTMLNIDSECEGTFLVSCAGGARIDLTFPMSRVTPEEGKTYRIVIKGLTGGHSGTEIDKGRANAIVLMGQIFKKLADARLILAYNDIKGGTADNAIANTCEATLLARTIEPELFEIIKFEVLEKYMAVEPSASITLMEVSGDEPKDWYYSSETLLSYFLTALPNGVIAMSKDIEGLVETSLNQGIIKMDGEGVTVSISVRSNVDEKKQELIDTLLGIAAENHVKAKVHGDYPGWAYRKDSPLREKMCETWERLYGEKPGVMALHAGLECGVFAKKIKDLDCVSFGPNLFDIHTTKEKLSLSSAERIWNFLCDLLQQK